MTDPSPTPPDETTYPARFAGPRRNSVVQAVAGATGTIAWAEDLPPEQGRDLLVWSGQILVIDPKGIVTLHGKDGRPIWQRTRRASTPVVIGNGNAYFATGGSLQAVRPSNDLSLDGKHIPALGGSETFLEMVWPRRDDFIAIVTMPNVDHDEQTGEIGVPFICASRKVFYGGRLGGWREEYDGFLRLEPLFVPETSRLIVCAEKTVISVDVDSAVERRFDLPIDRPLDWSADPKGVLAVMGMHGGKKVLLALDAEGTEKWRFVDGTHADEWAPGQPPVGSASGRLAVLTSKRVLAFDAHELAWQVEVTGATPSRASLLDDGSLLVACGRELLAIDAAGRQSLVVELPSEIVTSPVVDAAGTIYVATASRLFAIR